MNSVAYDTLRVCMGAVNRVVDLLRGMVLMICFPGIVVVALMLWLGLDAVNPAHIAHKAMLFGVLPMLIGLALMFAAPFSIQGSAYASLPIWMIAGLSLLVPLTQGWGRGFLPFEILGGLASVMGVSVALFNAVAARRAPAPERMAESNAPATPASSTDLREIPAVRSKLSFADVVGMDALKARMSEAAQEIIASRQGSTSPRNGILLSGEPGNGKTFFAQALAGEMKLPIMTVSFSQVASRWVNQGSEQVREAFAEARRQAPCVLFLDEVDSVLVDRAQVSNADSESVRTTNLMLTELVDIRTTGVVVIAATNYPDKLDPAARREGRFDFKIEIPPPDAAAREALIARSLKAYPKLSITRSAVDQAVKRWEGFSVARIRAVMEEAARQAVKAGNPCLQYADIKQALRTVQGRQGHLPADTPALADLSMAPAQHGRLLGIAKRMLHIEQIEEQGGTVPTGLLFAGPPGTGKTLTARALAKTSEWAFLSTCGADLISDQEAVDKLIRNARDMRPCIVFIDEADDVLGMRQGASAHVAMLTNKLLTAMDGAAGKASDVLWIAATNHPEQLDPAVLRRLVEKIEFAPPDVGTLALFIGKWLAGKTMVALETGLTPQRVAANLAGLSIAHVQEVLQQAVNLSIANQPTQMLSADTRTSTVIRAQALRAAYATVVGNRSS